MDELRAEDFAEIMHTSRADKLNKVANAATEREKQRRRVARNEEREEEHRGARAAARSRALEIGSHIGSTTIVDAELSIESRDAVRDNRPPSSRIAEERARACARGERSQKRGLA